MRGKMIGFAGKAGAGKDTAAGFLVEAGFARVAFADPMKRMVRDVFDFSREQLWGSSDRRNEPDKRYPRNGRFVFPNAPLGAVWIPLANGRGHALIDEEDFVRVTVCSWARNAKEEGKSTDYVRAYVDGAKVSLHAFLLGAPLEGHVIDHRNGDGLDNRRKNLRLCTHAENRCNQKKRKDGLSPFKGVGPAKNGGWRAYIVVKGEQLSLGIFEREEQAALAYDVVAREHFGEFARLNTDMFLTPRYALQTLGTNWGRDCYESVWIDKGVAVAEKLLAGGVEYDPEVGFTWTSRQAYQGVAFTDVRFANEAARLREKGVHVCRIDRPESGLSGAAGKHASEAEISGLAVDSTIANDLGLGELRMQVERVRNLLRAG